MYQQAHHYFNSHLDYILMCIRMQATTSELFNTAKQTIQDQYTLDSYPLTAATQLLLTFNLGISCVVTPLNHSKQQQTEQHANRQHDSLSNYVTNNKATLAVHKCIQVGSAYRKIPVSTLVGFHQNSPGPTGNPKSRPHAQPSTPLGPGAQTAGHETRESPGKSLACDLLGPLITRTDVAIMCIEQIDRVIPIYPLRKEI